MAAQVFVWNGIHELLFALRQAAGSRVRIDGAGDWRNLVDRRAKVNVAGFGVLVLVIWNVCMFYFKPGNASRLLLDSIKLIRCIHN